MKSENVYTSVACNRTTESADWGNNGLIVFGACNAVGICDPQYAADARGQTTAKILHTYVRHTKRVNTVQWLRGDSDRETHFLSGADDGLALLWNIADADAPHCHPLKGHESGVNAVGGLWRASTKSWLLATAAADSTLRLWRFDGGVSDAAECIQTLHLNSGFCFTLRLVALPTAPTQALLAFSADDETVALWAQTDDAVDAPFRLVHKLRGHEDWVRGLDFARDDDDLLLASSAQDNFIRLWRIAPRTEQQVRDNSADFLRLLSEGTELGKKQEGEEEQDLKDIRVEEKIVQLGASAADSYAVSLESVLYGHEGWVYGVHWHKSEEHGLRLLSASIDKTLIIWAPTDEGIWMEQVRVGEVGGNSLGFFGGKFASDGKSIFGHGYQGGFHIWQQQQEQQQQSETTMPQRWTPQVTVGGHYGEVRDLAWEPQGEYLLTVSADQTTRLHAPWRRAATQQKDDDAEAADEGVVTWHELARPQVHGYDMQALALLSRYKFASGAEEKIVRTFQAPANFIENFRSITRMHSDAEGDALLTTLPKGASVPSLGLSNKAVYSTETAAVPVERHVKDQYPENYFEAISLESPPQEETLMQNTLWPEVQKLYGHGYEIYALAATHGGDLLASACRSSNAEHAQIILWNPANWKQIQKLASHQLTVTQLRFSPNGRYLLSVSRDRRWSLFERQQADPATNATNAVAHFALAAGSDKTNGVHARIIWACDWSHDSEKFATASRDGKVVVWVQKSTAAAEPSSSLKGWHAASVLELKNESITAVAFAPRQLPCGAYVVALGFETGLIRIYRFDGAGDGQWLLLLCLTNAQSHHLTVRRLQFRPTGAPPVNSFDLASCGDDNLVRIYHLDL